MSFIKFHHYARFYDRKTLCPIFINNNEVSSVTDPYMPDPADPIETSIVSMRNGDRFEIKGTPVEIMLKLEEIE